MSVVSGSATTTRPRRLDEEGLPFDDETTANPFRAIADPAEVEARMGIVIVGHVDHGKSTIIGRLLADTEQYVWNDSAIARSA